MGNHDLMAYRHALDDPQALSSVVNHGGAWLLDLPKDVLIRIGHRLRALPLAIEVETSGGPIGLVHADFPSDDWRSIDTPFSEDDVGISLWSTMRFDRLYSAKVLNVRALIHGHLTVSTAQQIANVFFIDTGGWMHGSGHFTFTELESLELIRGPGGNASFRAAGRLCLHHAGGAAACRRAQIERGTTPELAVAHHPTLSKTAQRRQRPALRRWLAKPSSSCARIASTSRPNDLTRCSGCRCTQLCTRPSIAFA